MQEMGWSWADLQATPLSVRLDTQRCLSAQAQARTARASGGKPAGVPVDLAALQAAQPDYFPPE